MSNNNNAFASVVNFENSFSDTEIFSHVQILNKNTVSESVSKAVIRNDDIRGNNVNSRNISDNSLSELIEPQYDPLKLLTFYNLSDSLHTCIDAYKTNITGFGHDFVSEIDVIEENNIFLDRNTKKEIDKNIVDEIKKEHEEIIMFFNALSLDMTWLEITELITALVEGCGNSYLEIERDRKDKKIIGVTLCSSQNIRMTKFEKKKIQITQYIKNPFTFEYKEIVRFKSFRKFVEFDPRNSGSNVYFKEFGDPRVMNALDGKFLTNEKGDFLTELPNNYETSDDFIEATEIYHFKLFDLEYLDGYGVPRWLSLVPVLLGVRNSDLINFNLLKNKGIPDLVVTVEGARAGTMKKQIDDQVHQNKINGNIGNMLILEVDMAKTGAIGQDSSSKPVIKVQPLSQLLTKEGMFMSYRDKANERISSIFRLPSMFVGKVNEMNRATAEIAKQITDEQVFSPLRLKFDEIIKRTFITDRKFKYFNYKSKSSKLEDSVARADITLKSVQNSLLSPNEGRKEIGAILSKDLKEINDESMNKPLLLTAMNNFISNNQNTTNNVNQTTDSQVNNVKENQKQEDLMKLELTENSEVLKNIKEIIEKRDGVKVTNFYYHAKVD